jgi:hypothetical protein
MTANDSVPRIKNNLAIGRFGLVKRTMTTPPFDFRPILRAEPTAVSFDTLLKDGLAFRLILVS